MYDKNTCRQRILESAKSPSIPDPNMICDALFVELDLFRSLYLVSCEKLIDCG